MHRNFVATSCLLLILAAMFGFCSSSPLSSVQSKSVKDSIGWIVAPFVPESADFASEVMPLEKFDVRENFERELIVNMNFHSNTLQYLKRVPRYFPVIEPILRKHSIPDDFKYLALIESDFLNKISPKGATGFWQFTTAAAADYGLEVNNEVDERYNVEKSTEAACKYLNEAYCLYGNWTLAAASYNMGKAGLNKQIERQKCKDYYDLLLNEETMRYIYRIVAVKQILNNPRLYGFDVPEEEKYQEISYTEVEVSSSVANWTDWAIEHETNYKMLKYLNPWLREICLTNKARKTYLIKVLSNNDK